MKKTNIDEILKYETSVFTAYQALSAEHEKTEKALAEGRELAKRSLRKLEISTLLSEAQKNLTGILRAGRKNEEFRKLVENLFVHGASTKGHYRFDARKKESADLILELAREDDKPRVAEKKVVIIAFIIAKKDVHERKIGQDVSRAEIKIMTHEHDFSHGSTFWSECEFYENEHLDQVLRSLTKPESAIRTFVRLPVIPKYEY
ncbi:MAG TPA: hypothetical protein VJI66_00045 [Candidatus Paceibacterota bacterium]